LVRGIVKNITNHNYNLLTPVLKLSLHQLYFFIKF
jgi:hypothetical protein